MNERNEIHEAIVAGQEAIEYLEEAKRQLDAASSWGIIDMFSSGMISNLVKHMKIDNAKDALQSANDALDRFRDELNDIRDIYPVEIEISSFMTFADYVFDNFFVDLAVQDRINEAKSRVVQAIDEVNDILADLYAY